MHSKPTTDFYASIYHATNITVTATTGVERVEDHPRQGPHR